MENKNNYIPLDPGLREKVIKCIDHVIDKGFNIAPGRYFNDDEDGFAVCALGAISVCENPAKTEDYFSTSHALSLKHLGCDPWILESIEAGFEGMAGLDETGEFLHEGILAGVGYHEHKVSLSKNDCVKLGKMAVYNKAAYELGEYIFDTYAKEYDDDEDF